jgi:hypothetical protein
MSENNKMEQEQIKVTQPTVDNIDTGVSALGKLSDLIKKHGFFGILQSLFMFILVGYSVFFVTNPTYIFEKYDQFKTKQHDGEILKTFKSTSEINDMLKTYMYSEATIDRIFYIEFHNSIKGLDRMPYIYGSFKHEFVRVGREYMSDEFKDDFMLSKYMVFDYIYAKKQFCGTLDELRHIDERSGVMLSSVGIGYISMIMIECDGIPVGVLGITSTEPMNNLYDLTRIGYTLIAKKTN